MACLIPSIDAVVVGLIAGSTATYLVNRLITTRVNKKMDDIRGDLEKRIERIGSQKKIEGTAARVEQRIDGVEKRMEEADTKYQSSFKQIDYKVSDAQRTIERLMDVEVQQNEIIRQSRHAIFSLRDDMKAFAKKTEKSKKESK
jgi:phenylalanyl-tRNA synthetase alpha subunit